MIRQIEEGDTKGGIIIPKDEFKEFVEFSKNSPSVLRLRGNLRPLQNG